MITLSKEQIQQKINRLAQLSEEAVTLYQELYEAGALELSDDQLAAVNAAGDIPSYLKKQFGDNIFQIPGGGYFIL